MGLPYVPMWLDAQKESHQPIGPAADRVSLRDHFTTGANPRLLSKQRSALDISDSWAGLIRLLNRIKQICGSTLRIVQVQATVSAD